LITYDATNSLHICNGQTPYGTPLECGIYYYLINNKYQSEDFKVIVNVTEGTANTNSIISVSGLFFYNINYDIPDYQKKGAPNITFATEYGTNLSPLPFQYSASEVITSFNLVKINRSGTILSTTVLSTNLIKYDNIDDIHICDGNTSYDDIVLCGLYYFEVNSKYRSKAFEILELLCPIIENIAVSNAIEGDTAVLNYDAYLTGAEIGVDVDITYSFSCDISTYTESITLTPTSQNITSNFVIPIGVSGACSLTITNNVCSKAYTYNFTIIGATCLELIGTGAVTGNLELIGGGCLELIS
jgi:hypothetical protein